jgi:hypothetical protein
MVLEKADNKNVRTWKAYQSCKHSKETIIKYDYWVGIFQRWRSRSDLGEKVVDSDIIEFQDYILHKRNPIIGLSTAQGALKILQCYYKYILPGNTIMFRLITGTQLVTRPHRAYSYKQIETLFCDTESNKVLNCALRMLYDVAGRVQDVHNFKWKSVSQMD